MGLIVTVKRIPVSQLIDILIKFEKKGKKYVDLECCINEPEFHGDGVVVFSSKKSKKIKNSKKEKLQDSDIEELLSHV